MNEKQEKLFNEIEETTNRKRYSKMTDGYFAWYLNMPIEDVVETLQELINLNKVRISYTESKFPKRRIHVLKNGQKGGSIMLNRENWLRKQRDNKKKSSIKESNYKEFMKSNLEIKVTNNVVTDTQNTLLPNENLVNPKPQYYGTRGPTMTQIDINNLIKKATGKSPVVFCYQVHNYHFLVSSKGNDHPETLVAKELLLSDTRLLLPLIDSYLKEKLEKDKTFIDTARGDTRLAVYLIVSFVFSCYSEIVFSFFDNIYRSRKYEL